jgi:hypothetical protein
MKNKNILSRALAFLILTSVFVFLPMMFVGAEKLNYVPLSGTSTFSGFQDEGADSGDLGQFLAALFKFGLAIAAALAVVMIVWGGVEIMLSESVMTKTDGKKRVEDAIWGLLLALVSWLILWTINPDLVTFRI